MQEQKNERKENCIESLKRKIQKNGQKAKIYKMPKMEKDSKKPKKKTKEKLLKVKLHKG